MNPTLTDIARQGIRNAHDWFRIAESMRLDAAAFEATSKEVHIREDYKTLGPALAARMQQRYREMADDCRVFAEHADAVGRDLQAQVIAPGLPHRQAETTTLALTVLGARHCLHCHPDCRVVHIDGGCGQCHKAAS